MPSLQNIKIDIQKPLEANISIADEPLIASSTKNIELKEVKLAIQAYALDMKANNRMFEFVLVRRRIKQFFSVGTSGYYFRIYHEISSKFISQKIYKDAFVISKLYFL